MSRPANTVGTNSMTVSVAPQIKQYLLDLTAKGVFGNTPQEVLRNLVQRQIQQLIKEKELTERRWQVKPDGTVEEIPL
jgi:translation elongation factor EF-Ts